jgi:hypothetical protein
VDIDTQAVEVTKLSLLLKVLEGETKQTIDNQTKLFQERALPDLSNNIKCGNSLIGSDFYQGTQIDMFDDEERYRINVFDWEKEFPEVFAAGGFDAVIGIHRMSTETLANSRRISTALQGISRRRDLYRTSSERRFRSCGMRHVLVIVAQMAGARTTATVPPLAENNRIEEIVDFAISGIR